jgi:citrate lyase subunit beta/citryl-CoA lyase
VWVCVNPWPTGHVDVDVEAVVCPALTGICLAKAADDGVLAALDGVLSHAEEVDSRRTVGVMVQPLIDSACSVLEVRSIAGSPRVDRLQLGELDLAADLGAEPDADGTEMLLTRSQIVLASAAARIGSPVAPVQADFRDAQRFARTTAALKRMGFGSRACIDPSQVQMANEAFTPTAAEIERARAIVGSFEDAISRGSGVFASEGRGMMDEAVVLPAEQTGERGEDGAVRRRVTWPRHLAAEHGQLVAEHRDLDVLFVRRRTEPDQVEHAADEQEGDLTGHPDDPGRCASPLLTHQILSLHPTAYLLAELPGPLRQLRGRPQLLPAFLQLVQCRPPTFRYRLPHTADVHYGRAELVRAQRGLVLGTT